MKRAAEFQREYHFNLQAKLEILAGRAPDEEIFQLDQHDSDNDEL